MNWRWLLRSTLIIMLMTLLTLSMTYAHTPPERMAQYMPADVDFFAVIRSDSDFINRLDQLFIAIGEQLPNNLSQPLSINALINQVIAQSTTLPIQLDVVNILMQALGDWAGIGIDGIPEAIASRNSTVRLYLTVDIGNHRMAQTLITLMAGALGLEVRPAIHDYRVYSMDDLTLAINETLLHIAYQADLNLALGRSLQDVSLFTEGIRQLPRNDYDLWAYFNTPAVSLPLIQDAIILRMLRSFDVDDKTLGASVAGVVLDDDGLTIDLVQRRDVPQTQTNISIDPSFWQFIPAPAQFFVHTTDFTHLVGSTTSVLSAISASDTPELIMRDFMQLTRLFLNADLQADILSWTHGDYAVWGKFPSVIDVQTDIIPLSYIGIVFETTLPQDSRRLVDLLTKAAQTQFGHDAVFNLNRTTINASDVVFIRLPSYRAGFLPPEIAIGANDEIFFIATLAAAQDLLHPHSDYSGAIPHLMPTFLEAPKVAIYLNGDAIGEIGTVFATLIEPLQTFFFSELSTPQILQAYRTAFAQLFPALSLSAKADEQGDVIIRLVAQINTVPHFTR